LTTASWVPAPHGLWGSALWTAENPLETVALAGESWWAVGGIVNFGRCRFLACSVHLDAAAKGRYIGSAHGFLNQLQELNVGLPMVIGGDWNLTVGERQPDEDLPLSKAGKILLMRMREEFGLVSGWSLCNPGVHLPQTLRWPRAPTLRFHCDGIFVSSDWHTRVRNATVLSDESWTKLSDHNPVIVELELPSAP
jgi:endonuclease/exonuclease/phosphatase family metal-dependent hydrolase